jgi:hypothetical protein
MPDAQPSLFDPILAQVAATEGIGRADKNADPQWKKDMLQALRLTAERLVLFTADDVRLEMEKFSSETHEPSALGAIFRKAQSLGWITATNQFRCSERVVAHGRPVRVWESKLV